MSPSEQVLAGGGDRPKTLGCEDLCLFLQVYEAPFKTNRAFITHPGPSLRFRDGFTFHTGVRTEGDTSTGSHLEMGVERRDLPIKQGGFLVPYFHLYFLSGEPKPRC